MVYLSSADDIKQVSIVSLDLLFPCNKWWERERKRGEGPPHHLACNNIPGRPALLINSQFIWSLCSSPSAPLEGPPSAATGNAAGSCLVAPSDTCSWE